jgi:cytoskeletal protein RodZ
MAVPQRLILQVSLMVSAGHFLREERKARGMPLSLISTQTKISVRLLEAIEEDEISQIPSAFLYKSFVRQFASALSIDFKLIADRVNVTAAEFPTVRIPGEGARPIKLAPVRSQREGLSGWASRVFSLLAVIAICSGLYAYVSGIQAGDITSWRNLEADASNKTGAMLSSLWSGLIVTVRSNRSLELETQNRTVPRTSGKPPEDPSRRDDPILLRIAAVEKTWLSIESDGHHIFSGLLEPRDSKVLEGLVSARIRTGNAGGLTVMFNGRQLGPLGQRGQVRTIVFTSDDHYEILQPSLTSQLELFQAVSLTRWTR